MGLLAHEAKDAQYLLLIEHMLTVGNDLKTKFKYKSKNISYK